MDGSGYNPTKRDKIPSQVWNRIVRATGVVEGDAHSISSLASAQQRTPCHLLAKNRSSQTLSKHSIVQFKPGDYEMSSGDPADVEAEMLLEHLGWPSMQTHPPEESAQCWGVTVDPMAPDAFGRTIVVGLVMCRVNVTSTNHYAAIPQDNNYTALQSASGGANSAQIVWRSDRTGEQWCLIRLGSAPAAGGIRISYTDSAWGKGTSREVWIYNAGEPGSEQTAQAATRVTAWNLFATIPQGRKVALGYNADFDTYYVIAAEC